MEFGAAGLACIARGDSVSGPGIPEIAALPHSGYWAVPGNGRPYDVHPDGERLLMILGDFSSGPLGVVQNWRDGLEASGGS